MEFVSQPADQPASLWSPPEGFIVVHSQVDGIEVYAPAPKAKEDKETHTFKCRHCGGTISFSASERQLTCPYCGGSQEVAAEEVPSRPKR
jgi:hypothetical protein